MPAPVQAPVCPYCGLTARLADSSLVYGKGRSYGPVWACAAYPGCNAYVGCHPGSDRPLGRLADRKLRQWKRRAHDAFDPTWQVQGRGSRKAAYRWLALQLGLHEDDCHIGMFDVEMCKRVVTVCGGRLDDGAYLMDARGRRLPDL